MTEAMETEFLTLAEVLALHEEMIRTIGGKYGVKDDKMLDSALAQPQMTFGAEDFYPTVAESHLRHLPSRSFRITHSTMATSGPATPRWSCSWT